MGKVKNEITEIKQSKNYLVDILNDRGISSQYSDKLDDCVSKVAANWEGSSSSITEYKISFKLSVTGKTITNLTDRLIDFLLRTCICFYDVTENKYVLEKILNLCVDIDNKTWSDVFIPIPDNSVVIMICGGSDQGQNSIEAGDSCSSINIESGEANNNKDVYVLSQFTGNTEITINYNSD